MSLAQQEHTIVQTTKAINCFFTFASTQKDSRIIISKVDFVKWIEKIDEKGIILRFRGSDSIAAQRMYICTIELPSDDQNSLEDRLFNIYSMANPEEAPEDILGYMLAKSPPKKALSKERVKEKRKATSVDDDEHVEIRLSAARADEIFGNAASAYLTKRWKSSIQGHPHGNTQTAHASHAPADVGQPPSVGSAMPSATPGSQPLLNALTAILNHHIKDNATVDTVETVETVEAVETVLSEIALPMGHVTSKYFTAGFNQSDLGQKVEALGMVELPELPVFQKKQSILYVSACYGKGFQENLVVLYSLSTLHSSITVGSFKPFVNADSFTQMITNAIETNRLHSKRKEGQSVNIGADGTVGGDQKNITKKVKP